MASKFTILVAIFLGIVTASKGEVFTALAHMKGLIDLEQELLVELEQYIKTHPKMPVKFHELVNEVKTHSGFIQGDVETFLGHPVNAYMLIRRFRGRWVDLGNYFNQHDKDSELAEIINFNINTTTSKQDVYGCVGAIMRIQEVYRIDAKAIADGNLSHKTKTLPLNADVCFEMGFAYYKNDDFDHAYSWFNETLARLNLPDYKGELTRVHVLEYQAWSEYMTDRLIDALNHTMEILRMDHNNDFGIRNIEFLTDEVQKALNKGGPYERQDPYFKSKKKAKEEYMEVYERLCRGEAKKSKEELAQLYCYYERKRHPMLLIRPLKVEIVNHEPYIVMLRDVMYDSEIDYIKARAAPMLNRATVTNPTTGDLEYADYRVSKSGWLEDHLHDSPDNILKRVNRRISVITGLDARRTSAEALQIVNYGTAGHYEPHYDHATESYSAIMRLGMGNRIATVLFYMTDVEAGGYTVFVDTEAISKPSKGDAAFWYNLMRSGEGDPYTRHAGCPVVVGSKWVCNKWIHEHGQEFRRPCTLSIDE